jgi:S-DNA-T family DNA segregation ATPase FtsK/SpoIIIE
MSERTPHDPDDVIAKSSDESPEPSEGEARKEGNGNKGKEKGRGKGKGRGKRKSEASGQSKVRGDHTPSPPPAGKPGGGSKHRHRGSGSQSSPLASGAEHSRAGEFLGVVLLALGLLAFAALLSLQFGSGNLMGPFGRMLALSLYALLGLGGYLVVLAVGVIGLRTLIGRGQTLRWSVWAGYLGATLCGAVLFHCLFPHYVVYGFTAGGKGGEIIGELLIALFSHAGTYLVTAVLMLLCLMVATEASLVQSLLGAARAVARLWHGLNYWAGKTWRTLRRVFTWQAMEAAPSAHGDGSMALSAPVEAAEAAPEPAPGEAPDDPPASPPENDAPAPDKAPAAATAAPQDGPRIVEPAYRRQQSRSLGPVLPVDAEGFKLPSLELLETPATDGQQIDRDGIQSLARRLARALDVFGIQGEVTEVHPGPVVTLYEFRPAPGTKLSKIESLDRDLALTLKATSVRVARIRGKDTVGIEVPNKHRETVLIQELLADPVFTETESLLTLGLGKDISGSPTVCNLAKAPHLLVAGSTGSGKSVGINVMLMSLLFRARPDQVRLILIDPKMLEFSIYEDIPHLLLPVVTDPKQANQALRWAVTEMDRRYQLMGEASVRNITDYNDLVERRRRLAEQVVAQAPDPEHEPALQPAAEAEPPPEPLPYIVIVIDEFADLMMVAAKEVEHSVARIAQKARAAGIHLILATQRPSRDVITGIIKANFPSRLSFQVSSKVDSRVILDRNGAEALLGMGDLLFSSSGKAPERLQGAFVSTAEVSRVVEHLKQQADPAYNLDILESWDEEGEGFDLEEEKDDMYDKAVFLVTQHRRASTSWIQRQLRVGYNRAARILELMEHEGVVGPQQAGARNREVLAPPPPEAPEP